MDDAALARVRAFVEDEWVVDAIDEFVNVIRTEAEAEDSTDRNLNALLESVESPLELHAMVAGFNWDCGAGSVLRVLRHPAVDPSTILMAYWLAAPRYWASRAADGLAAVPTLHDMLTRCDPASARISFDPASDKGFDWTAEYRDPERSLRETGRMSLYVVPPEFERPFKRQ